MTTAALKVIDSHTAGEPTRVVIEGMPSLGDGTMLDRRERMRREADWVRRALTREPRGADWMVGAVLQPPRAPKATAGVIFFNNAGYLGMCGHGLIGVVTTLAWLGQINPGEYMFETPVGDVAARLHEDKSVSIENVISYRAAERVQLQVPARGTITGDVAYGGNWFFLTEVPHISPERIGDLWQTAQAIMHALQQAGIRGTGGETIDHVELTAPPSDPRTADARNFVLCPGGHYDRSPCGTGTSAKMACLAAEGKLSAGTIWRQESITGSLFEGVYRYGESGIIPTIQGRAFVTAETRPIIDPLDPFRYGFPISDRDAME